MSTRANPEDVARLAALSRIQVPVGELEAFAKDFDSIVAYIDQLNGLHTDTGGEPVLPALHNVFREDTNSHVGGEWTEAIASQFPAREGNSLSVKKILTHE